jgi:hypothetical protein
MRRRECDHPVQIQIFDDRLIRFRHGEREFEVIALLKMLALLRPRDDVDTQLWQVRARSSGLPEAVYELERDHGEWRMSAVWSDGGRDDRTVSICEHGD